jgi:hypothetical protein
MEQEQSPKAVPQQPQEQQQQSILPVGPQPQPVYLLNINAGCPYHAHEHSHQHRRGGLEGQYEYGHTGYCPACHWGTNTVTIVQPLLQYQQQPDVQQQQVPLTSGDAAGSAAAQQQKSDAPPALGAIPLQGEMESVIARSPGAARATSLGPSPGRGGSQEQQATAIPGYTGPTRHGVPHGVGRQEFRDGSVYVGGFAQGRRHGENATFTYANGDEYRGAFENDRKHGRGAYRWRDGSRYIGLWSNDQRCGAGGILDVAGAGAALRDHLIASFATAAPTVADVLETVLGEVARYEGDFAENVPHGNGGLVLSCGATIAVPFERGFVHGEGELRLCPGAVFRCKWRNGAVRAPIWLLADRAAPVDASTLHPDAARAVVREVLHRRGRHVGRGGIELLSFTARFDRSRATGAQRAGAWFSGALDATDLQQAQAHRQPAAQPAADGNRVHPLHQQQHYTAIAEGHDARDAPAGLLSGSAAVHRIAAIRNTSQLAAGSQQQQRWGQKSSASTFDSPAWAATPPPAGHVYPNARAAAYHAYTP